MEFAPGKTHEGTVRGPIAGVNIESGKTVLFHGFYRGRVDVTANHDFGVSAGDKAARMLPDRLDFGVVSGVRRLCHGPAASAGVLCYRHGDIGMDKPEETLGDPVPGDAAKQEISMVMWIQTVAMKQQRLFPAKREHDRRMVYMHAGKRFQLRSRPQVMVAAT